MSGLNPNEQYTQICSRRFDKLESMLTNIDIAVRGNGKPGLHVRVDRLERIAKILLWAGALLVTASLGMILKHM